jgi:hypothetical protein
MKTPAARAKQLENRLNQLFSSLKSPVAHEFVARSALKSIATFLTLKAGACAKPAA